MPDLPLLTPDELLLAQVVALARCSPKTVRRAASVGTLPHRYALATRGRYLAFKRVDVEVWIATRRPVARGGQESGDEEIGALSAAISDLSRALAARRRDAGALERQLAALDDCQERLRVLIAELREELR